MHPGEGWIEVICGSMFSGKTEELIRRLKRATFAKQNVRIFKPSFDQRYHQQKVVSHDFNEFDSISVNLAHDILGMSQGFEVIGIDEGQFFDEALPDVCNELAYRGVRVVVAGLDMDFKGKPFGPMPQLMAIAEYVTKLHAICVKTGRLAHYSHRIAGGIEQKQLGAGEAYEPLSRVAYMEALASELGEGNAPYEERD